MNSKIKLNILFGACALASVFTGCQDYDAGFTTKEISRAVFDKDYTANFIAEYGDLSQVKSWDLSSLGDELNYMGGALTRTATGEFSNVIDGDGNTYSYHPLSGCTEGVASNICSTSTLTINTKEYPNQTNSTYYYLPEKTFTWLTTNMTENVEHTSRDFGERSVKNNKNTWIPIPGAGNSFTFKKPESDFWLIPIYQGKAVSTYELHLVMGNKDYRVWTKGQGLEVEQYIYDYSSIVHYVDENNNSQTYRKIFFTDVRDNNPTYKNGRSIKFNYSVKEDLEQTQLADGTWDHVITYYVDQPEGSVVGKTTLNKKKTRKGHR